MEPTRIKCYFNTNQKQEIQCKDAINLQYQKIKEKKKSKDLKRSNQKVIQKKQCQQFSGNPVKRIKRSQVQISLFIDSKQYSQSQSHLLGNYPKVNKTQQLADPRLKALNFNIFTNKKVLEVGCNNGQLSLQIAMRCFPSLIVGLDIDSKLIAAAEKTKAKIISKNQVYQQKNKILINKIQQLPLYFKQKIAKQFNTKEIFLEQNISINIQGVDVKNQFPANVQFVNKNIFTMEQTFQCVVCFKMIRWIHLSYGDQGVRELFQVFNKIVREYLIIQVQGWESYRKKKNMNSIYKKNYSEITLDPINFSTLLSDYGFQFIEEIKKSQQLHNSIQIFKRIQ